MCGARARGTPQWAGVRWEEKGLGSAAGATTEGFNWGHEIAGSEFAPPQTHTEPDRSRERAVSHPGRGQLGERSLVLPHHTPQCRGGERTQVHTRAREMQGSNIHIHAAFP